MSGGSEAPPSALSVDAAALEFFSALHDLIQAQVEGEWTRYLRRLHSPSIHSLVHCRCVRMSLIPSVLSTRFEQSMATMVRNGKTNDAFSVGNCDVQALQEMNKSAGVYVDFLCERVEGVKKDSEESKRQIWEAKAVTEMVQTVRKNADQLESLVDELIEYIVALEERLKPNVSTVQRIKKLHADVSP